MHLYKTSKDYRKKKIEIPNPMKIYFIKPRLLMSGVKVKELTDSVTKSL